MIATSYLHTVPKLSNSYLSQQNNHRHRVSNYFAVFAQRSTLNVSKPKKDTHARSTTVRTIGVHLRPSRPSPAILLATRGPCVGSAAPVAAVRAISSPFDAREHLNYIMTAFTIQGNISARMTIVFTAEGLLRIEALRHLIQVRSAVTIDHQPDSYDYMLQEVSPAVINARIICNVETR
jgi:hypothetical protein